MKCNIVFLLVCLHIQATVSDSCNTWYTKRNGVCSCGPDFGGLLRCSECNETVDISAGFCMTYDVSNSTDAQVNDSSSDTLVVGYCLFSHLSHMTADGRYSHLPTDPAQVNSTLCDPYKRKGLFCGKCQEGFGPAVYSFDLHCANCSHMSTATAVSLYLLLELVPITVFFFVVLVFRPSLWTGPRLGYFVFCQAIANTVQHSSYAYVYLIHTVPQPIAVVGHIGIVIAGVWNLDFFCFLIPPFCISANLSDINVQSLSINSTLFPLFLVLLTYTAIELSTCYPKFIQRLFSSYNAKHSVIHAFATFMMPTILSTLCRAYTFLQRTPVLDISGNVKGTVLQLDPSIEMWSRKHYPYVITSLSLVCFLVLCPALFLFVYPTRLYRALSGGLSTRKQLALKIFAETINCGFKDRLNGTKDYRMIPGAFFLVILSYVIIKSFVPHSGYNSFAPFAIGTISFLFSFLIAYLRPGKLMSTNISLSFHVFLLGILSTLIGLMWQGLTISSHLLGSCIAFVLILPHLIMVVRSVNKIIQTYRCIKFINNIKLIIKKRYKRVRSFEVGDGEGWPLLQ